METEAVYRTNISCFVASIKAVSHLLEVLKLVSVLIRQAGSTDNGPILCIQLATMGDWLQL